MAHSSLPAPDLEQLIRNGQISVKFSPVRDLLTGAAAGYKVLHEASEAAADSETGETRSITERELRSALGNHPMVGDFDLSLRDIGLRAAGDAGLTTQTRLFFKTEPESLVTLEDRSGEPDRSVILQLDPSRIAENPAAVMRNVRGARQLGWGIGMRNVGLTLRSAAFLPLVNPSVVSLDRGVLDMRDDAYLAQLTWLLHAHTERTGAIIMAEGVRDEKDLELARALGVRLISGPLIGAPEAAPEPEANAAEDPIAEHFTRNKPVQGTPYSIARALGRESLLTTSELLGNEILTLLRRARYAGESAIVIGVLGEMTELPYELVEEIEAVAENCAVTTVVSGGFDTAPIPGVRTSPLDSSDPLREEFAVLVVGPDWSGMVAANRRPDPGSEGRVMYDVHVTTDRYVSVDAARSVMSRLAPERRG